MMATADPLRSAFTRMEAVLRSGRRVFLVGNVPFPASGERPLTLRPAYKDARGHWHGGEFGLAWKSQTGYFLGVNVTSADAIDVPVPNNAKVQEYENPELGVVQGWRKKTLATP